MRLRTVCFVMLLFATLQFSFAQEKTVTGTVKDQSGMELPGVAIVVKGEQKGTQTEFDGTYSLKVDTGKTLVFSYIGMKTQEIRVGASSTIDVVLEEDAQLLDDVVVVGFGQKRAVKELTGSVGKVGEEIANNSSASIDKALAGKVAGVQGGMASGQPGGAALLRIRGMSSINGRNNPIYIVDGVRVAQGDLTSNTPTANILANMNESDIESVTILKDAVSTAVYGADAGAGVVIITTKSGKKGDAKFSVGAETGLTFRALAGEEPLNTSEWLGLLYDRYLNSSTRFATKDALIAALDAGTIDEQLQAIYNNRHIDTDWRKETERSAALLQKINGSVSGGTDKLTYYSSLGYYNQDGIVKNTGFNRVTNSNRVNYKANDRLTLATDIQVSFAKMYASSDGATFANPILGQYLLRPTDAVRNADGTFNYGRNGYMSNRLYNVAALQTLNHINAETTRLFGNFQADYKILKNLTYKFTFAPEYINIEEDDYRSPIHGDGRNLGGSMSSYTARNFNFNIQNTLTYDFTLAEKNHFSVMLAQEAYRSDRRVVGGRGDVVGSTNLRTLNNFVVPRTARGIRDVDSRGGYALNLHYDYDKIVLLDLSGRQDRLSNFWDENKTGYFWSAGVGVDFARLEALKSLDLFSQLKLSASYGKVGNLTDVSPYETYVYTANYADQAAAYPSGISSKDLRWEVINPLNVGIDVGLWNDRLTLGVAYYEKTTKDMVFSTPLSIAQGGNSNVDGTPPASQYLNIGEMKNSGIEISIGAKIIRNEGEGFNWSANANLSTLKNKITKLYGGEDIIVSSTRILREGEAVNSFYLREWAGVDPANGNPLWYKADGTTTSNYDEANRVILGNPLATLYGGFDTKLSYRGFVLDAQLSYGFGNKIYDSWAGYGLSDGLFTQTYPSYKSQLDYWTPENTDARHPKPMAGGNNDSREPSSRYLYKGDYVRLRTIKLAYTVKSELIEKSGIKGVQIYALGDNVWTYNFDKNFNYDPDMQVSGYANFALPPLRTYSLGVNVNF
ncbi:MAG: SusC/RagA family TonB-linked outer membrane protein [Capnocytophaga sp.]|nr:SusC/RagA family TonB-linked outer membrane protein [Capnocytophaga sp.]